MKKLKIYTNLLMLSFALILTSCVPPTPTPTPEATLTVSPSAQTVTVGDTAVAFTATLTNSTDTINWTLAGAGTLDTTTGATVNYTPPATGGAATATLTASAAGKTAVANVTVNAPAGTPSLSISPSTSTTTVGGGAVAFAANLQNSTDSTSNIVWAVSGTGGGTLSVATGAVTSFTPPATGTGGTTTLTATLGALSATATITINPATVPTLVVSPKTRDLIVEGVAVNFTAALTNSTDTITWSLTGAGSIPANSTGTTVSYTPPATGGATTATLTATAGALSDSAAITIAAKPVSTVTVTGKVLNFDGSAAAGINVQINDAATALKTTKQIGPVVTDGTGTFTLTGVQTPYTLSVIPPANVAAPQTWTNVTRTDPTMVVTPLAGPPICSAPKTPPAPGALTVNLSTPVGAGNTGFVIFLAPGIGNQNAGEGGLELLSNAVATVAAGGTTANLTVNFDPTICNTSASGKVIYLEAIGGNLNTIAKSGSVNATVLTGNTTTEALTVLNATTRELSGTVTFPAGTATTNVFMGLKVGSSTILVSQVTATAAAPTYSFAVPEISGVSTLSLAVTNATLVGTNQWRWSDVISTLPATANLALPNLGLASAPTGAIGNNTTPTFTFTTVTGANLYTSTLTNVNGAPTQWVGNSASTSLQIPALPAPATIAAGSVNVPNTFQWTNSAINVRAGGDSDTMLDGRQITKQFLNGQFGVFNPSDISAGSFNATQTQFSVP